MRRSQTLRHYRYELRAYTGASGRLAALHAAAAVRYLEPVAAVRQSAQSDSDETRRARGTGIFEGVADQFRDDDPDRGRIFGGDIDRSRLDPDPAFAFDSGCRRIKLFG